MSHLARRRALLVPVAGVFRVHGDVHTAKSARKLNRSDSVSYSRRIAVYRARLVTPQDNDIVNIASLEEATTTQDYQTLQRNKNQRRPPRTHAGRMQRRTKHTHARTCVRI